ncbi:hypothetical protein Tco_0434352 [Tanacetum coccineum]
MDKLQEKFKEGGSKVPQKESEQPLPHIPILPEGQLVAPGIHCSIILLDIKGSKEIAGIMILTMEHSPKNLENLHDYVMKKGCQLAHTLATKSIEKLNIDGTSQFNCLRLGKRASLCPQGHDVPQIVCAYTSDVNEEHVVGISVNTANYNAAVLDPGLIND